jgi:prepilin-type processing-associated H-X9-DG protein
MCDHSKQRIVRPSGLLWAIAIPLAVLGMLWLVVLHLREQAQSSQCQGCLKGIAFALFTYSQNNGCFPPAHLNAADGTRMHSWRALIPRQETIVPFSYDMREAWNGPHNSKLGDQRQNFLACPSDSETQRNTRLTNFFVIDGPKTPFPDTRCRSIASGAAFQSDTILAAEASGLNIEWLEPRDLDYSAMSFLLNDRSQPSISSAHPNGPNACMADGSVRCLGKDISPEVLKQMLNIQKGAWRESNPDGRQTADKGR